MVTARPYPQGLSSVTAKRGFGETIARKVSVHEHVSRNIILNCFSDDHYFIYGNKMDTIPKKKDVFKGLQH